MKRKAKRNGPLCCLTFDDGPSEWTPQVLDILKDKGIKATFFVTGHRAKERPDVVKRASAEGHEIGNHTATHRKLTFCTRRVAQREIEDCSRTLESITGMRPRLFRAPHGFKRPFLKGSLAKMGMALVPWTKGIWDTDMPPPDELVRRVAKKFAPLEILLLHDGVDNRPIVQDRVSTVKALPKIIDEYKKRGYRFATVSEITSKIASPL